MNVTFTENPYKEIFMEIERGLWEHDIRVDDGIASPYNYDADSLRAITKMFSSAMWVLSYKRMKETDISFDIQCLQAEILGEELKKFIYKFTGIDTVKLYD